MTEIEVKSIAEELIRSENRRDWSYELGNPERDARRPHEWKMFVRWIYPDGTPLDGPGIIIVDESTNKARFF